MPKMTQEARKDDQGKPRWDLLPVRALEEVVWVFTGGAGKYAEFNYLHGTGLSYRRLFRAMLGHVFSALRGNDIDPEFGRHHLAHAVCCGLMLLALIFENKGIDDRSMYFKEGQNAEQQKRIIEQLRKAGG